MNSGKTLWLDYWNEAPNFGDLLGPWILERNKISWQQWSHGNTAFQFIGTIIGNDVPGNPNRLIAGAGLGYGERPQGCDLDIRFVRGPLTAEKLGNCKWVTDPAYLVADELKPLPPRGISIIPHHGCSWSFKHGGWHWPNDVETTLHKIRTSQFVIAGSMHAAIVADALGIPWECADTGHHCEFKWQDWLASVGVDYRPPRNIKSILESPRPQLSHQDVRNRKIAKLKSEMEKLQKEFPANNAETDMSLGKVFGIGLPKTGTQSLSQALNQLGYQCVHYLNDPQTTSQLVNGDYRLKSLENLDAACDVPIPPIFRELDSAFPGSKFILTTRDIDEWIESHRHAPFNAQDNVPDPSDHRYLYRLMTYGVVRFSEEKFRNAYKSHLEQVMAYFHMRATDQLLVLDVNDSQKWEKLCKFLGKVPPAVEYPHANRREA